MAVASGQFYHSKDGDMLDRVVFDVYGMTAGGRLETVLAANAALGVLGPILPAGLDVWLPDIEEEGGVQTVQLWG